MYREYKLGPRSDYYDITVSTNVQSDRSTSSLGKLDKLRSRANRKTIGARRRKEENSNCKRSLDRRFGGGDRESDAGDEFADRRTDPGSSRAGFHEAYMIELYVN